MERLHLTHMKIDKYEKIAKSKYRLYLSNGEVIDTYDEIILKNDLLIKKELDNYLYQKVLSESKLQEFYNACIKYISIRIRSTKEIIDYLKSTNGADEDIDYILEKLTKEKLLDDNHFCECFIKDKLKFTTMGEHKIIYELKKQSISADIIANNHHLISEDILIGKIDKIIIKQLNSNRKLDRQKLRNKLYNHLLNAGYSSSLIVKRLNNYF